MSQNAIISKYGIHSDKIRKLKGQFISNNKSVNPEIRRIGAIGSVEYEIIASIAIFSRVPISWLLQATKPKLNIWTVHHFAAVNDVHFTEEQFINYLNTTEKKSILKKTKHTRPNFIFLYDIRPVILDLHSKQIYLRVSFYENGGFIIELFGADNQLNDFALLKNILTNFGPFKIGYCETVISGHVNMMIIAKSRAKKIQEPIEFVPFM